MEENIIVNSFLKLVNSTVDQLRGVKTDIAVEAMMNNRQYYDELDLIEDTFSIFEFDEHAKAQLDLFNPADCTQIMAHFHANEFNEDTKHQLFIHFYKTIHNRLLFLE